MPIYCVFWTVRTWFSEHLEAQAYVFTWRQKFENCILGELKICRLRHFLSLLSLRAESDPSIYGYKHLLKNVKKMKNAITISMLTSQRQYFAELDVFIFCLDFLPAINTDWLCILLLPTDCSLSTIRSYV